MKFSTLIGSLILKLAVYFSCKDAAVCQFLFWIKEC